MKPFIQRATVVTFLSFSALLTGCNENKDSATVSTTNGVADADNTGKNTRDRNDATLTPGDQGGSAGDRDMTQKIRRAVTSGTNDYSMTAKNIKIITQNGKVTLRGPVKTEAEKAGIVNIAKSQAGEGNVDDQLEVKANP